MSNDTSAPSAIYLKDYTVPEFLITHTFLEFDLNDDMTEVRSRLLVTRNAESNSPSAPLLLHGQGLTLISLVIDGKKINSDHYVIAEETLTIAQVPDTFELECITHIKPQDNTSLEGLYRSQKMYCTQCEAEGFRKITYYLDRPDVMSEFTTKIIADATQFPVLLSNGNLTDSGTLEGGRHWVSWHDPFKKPAYLFALVAGDLAVIDDHYVTQSGREVMLRIFVEEKDKDKCDHAMVSLKQAMKWDEDVYGREYDLDIFMIVAVDDFNMGAMENKGLNIFNTSCVLAKPETTTDAGFQRVEAVVAHEYFHNWSGNRVTCRDWFQLSLKEGFTVFRDAEFSADMGSRTVKRVEDVSMLRTMQFAEDAGPMAHPVQPAAFIEISNFYTLTVYEKGAEVVRMIYTLLGAELFRKGSDLYFDRHDGQAVTIDDFVNAMAEVSGRDFTLFMHWYRQAGTPTIKITDNYQADTETYTLTVAQSCPATPEAKEKQLFHIPLGIGLLGEQGPLALFVEGDSTHRGGTHRVLEITEAEQTFVFNNVKEKPVPSLLRGFSAPVKLNYRYSRDALLRIMQRDDDGFCRWDASQQLATQVTQEVMAALVHDPAPSVDQRLIDTYAQLLEDSSLDQAMVALMLSLPSEQYLGQQQTEVDVDSIHHARNRVKRKIAVSLYDSLLSSYHRLNSNDVYSPDADSIAKRSLKNTVLSYLMLTGKDEALSLCQQQFEQAENMTDYLSAFTCIAHSTKKGIEEVQQQCSDSFYSKWKHESLVVNQWFSVHATNPAKNTLERIKALMEHEAFDRKNPNKLRALIGAFAMRNVVNFHAANGDGYRFLADQVLQLNAQNPQIASRLLTPLTRWKKYDGKRQGLMKAQLERIKALPDLSKDVYEVVYKSLV